MKTKQFVECFDCNGFGYVIIIDGDSFEPTEEITCPRCKGKKTIPEKDYQLCSGDLVYDESDDTLMIVWGFVEGNIICESDCPLLVCTFPGHQIHLIEKGAFK
jgi:DnaJ-class molecular chaperone